MMWVCQMRHEKAVRALLEKDADVGIRGLAAATALHVASLFGYNLSVSSLLDEGEDVFS